MKKKLKKYRFYLICLFAVVLIDSILIRELKLYVSDSILTETAEMNRILDEIQYFPIAADSTGHLVCDYVDSWQSERSFGGDRVHEGCDIITSVDQRGIYPVVSITDGIIEQMGWLRLGGYRIGIRSPNGIYYYYAHMESYAEDLTVGSKISAGQFLGFAGDSGYGEEGTTGQFVVHLHLGIYVPDQNGVDQAINPYPYLEKMKQKCIIADFSVPQLTGM